MADLNVNTLVNRIMERYDRNKDGKIQVPQNADGMTHVGDKANARQVFVADETQVRSSGEWVGSCSMGQQLSHKVVHMVSLFKDADTDGDGFVTRGDINNVIKSFDTNKNNIVGSEKVKGSPKTEIGLLMDNYPEEVNKTIIAVDPETQECYSDGKTFSNSVYGESLEKPAAPSTPKTKIEVIQDRLQEIDKQIGEKQNYLRSDIVKSNGLNHLTEIKQAKQEIASLKEERRHVEETLAKAEEPVGNK